MPPKKPLMNSSSGNGFNGSLGKTINVSARVQYHLLSTKFKVKYFLWRTVSQLYERAAGSILKKKSCDEYKSLNKLSTF